MILKSIANKMFLHWIYYLWLLSRLVIHDDVIKWKHFPRYWPFARGIHRSRMNSPNKGQWRGALMFSSICVCINGRVNNREAGDLRSYRPHYDVTVTDRQNSWLQAKHGVKMAALQSILKRDHQHFEAEAKWPLFCRRHFQIHFLEWKCVNFD